MFGHPGHNAPGATSVLVGFPETGSGAVIMTNSANGIDFQIKMLEQINKEYDWPLSKKEV
jgi:hypothetical protein